MDRVIIFGGTGFLGLSLAGHLSQKGIQPILVARNAPEKSSEFKFLPWDAVSLGDWKNELNGAKAIVNLTGKTVDCIKTPGNCDLILRSRIDATKIIGTALRDIETPPEVWVQMSTAHIYGDPPSQVCTESSTTGYGLAPTVGKSWEKAFIDSLPKNMRGVRLRTSFVIGRYGGALKSLKRIVRLGLGGKVGSGKQGMSWIHEFDLNEMICQSIEDKNFNGVYIASSPHPVSNRVFMQELRKAIKFPFGLPAPAFLARMGAHFIFRTDPELALYGRYVKSERLEKEGFQFRFPELSEALADLEN